MMMNDFVPSIWLGDFRSKSEYDERAPSLAAAFSVFDWIDDRILHSRHPFAYPAYCVVCNQVTQMHVDWHLSGLDNATGSINPAWTETSICGKCGSNSRMRALLDYLKTRCKFDQVRKAYISEQITPFYQILKKLIPSLVGSEYLGPDRKSGDKIVSWRSFSQIRHEDLTALSFSDAEFDLVITLDVFEHIPEYQKAFTEIWRVLTAGGYLVFSIPFFFDLEETRIRASISDKGVVHHFPPEIHGNPVSKDGSLCFQNFGWDILHSFREVGFADAMASLYWGPWQGHLGYPFFIFSAVKM